MLLAHLGSKNITKNEVTKGKTRRNLAKNKKIIQHKNTSERIWQENKF